MKSESLNKRVTPKQVRKSPAGENKAVETEQAKSAPQTGKATEGKEPAETVDMTSLASVLNVPTDALSTTQANENVAKSSMTLGLFPEDKKAEAEALGAVFPEIVDVHSDAGMGPEGKLGIRRLDDTNNPNTENIAPVIEVPKNLVEFDPVSETRGLKEGFHAEILEDGEGILPAGHYPAKNGTRVTLDGFVQQLGMSEGGIKAEKSRLKLNNLAATVGNVSTSSMAGLVKIPVLGPLSPYISVATALGTVNQQQELIKDSKNQLEYAERGVRKAGGDKITIEEEAVQVGKTYFLEDTKSKRYFGPANNLQPLDNGEASSVTSYPISAERHMSALNDKVTQAKSKLASTGLAFLAGSSSIVGGVAATGALGSGTTASLIAGATAATPYLAGAAMIVGSSGIVLNSVNKLKSLSEEKKKLLALQAQGKTHVPKTIEAAVTHVIEANENFTPGKDGPGSFQRIEAINEVELPIAERLKSIEKEQSLQRMMVVGISGAMAGTATSVAIGSLALAPWAVAPGALWAGGESVVKMRALGKEKKKLLALQKSGETVVKKEVQQGDGSWVEDTVPISNLLGDVNKDLTKHKGILTAVGSTSALLGMTMAGGMALSIAAPIALVPAAIIGAALFPDKVSEFAGRVGDMISGVAGPEAFKRRSVVKDTKKRASETLESLKKDLDALKTGDKAKDEALFGSSTKNILGQKVANGGYVTHLLEMVEDYAKSGSRTSRFQNINAVEQHLAKAPPELKEMVGKIKEDLGQLHMDTEARWVAHDVMLEMKTDTTKAVVNDARVKARLEDLNVPTDDIRGLREEALNVSLNPVKLNELNAKVENGTASAEERQASSLNSLFEAASHWHRTKEEYGTELFTKFVDAIHRPGDVEQLDLVFKEMAYKTGRPVLETTVDYTKLAVANLENPETLTGKPSDSMTNPEFRMNNAFRAIDEIDSKGAGMLSASFAELNDPDAYEGLSQQQAQAKRQGTEKNFNKAIKRLNKKAPEIFKLWDAARLDVERDAMERSLPHELMENVLARPEVAEAQERLGVSAEEAKGMLVGLARHEALGDARKLRDAMLDETGKEFDPKKEEMVARLDRSRVAVATEMLKGGAEPAAPKPAASALEDPRVLQILQTRPDIVQALNSAEFQGLAETLKMNPQDAAETFFVKFLIEQDPQAETEFQREIEGGNLDAARIRDVAKQVGDFITKATQPSQADAEKIYQNTMASPLVAQVLGSEDLQQQAAEAKVNLGEMVGILVRSDVLRDPTELNQLQVSASKGDVSAQAKLEVLSSVGQRFVVLNQQAQAQGGQVPPQAA